jgi:hypothetical protein
LLLAVAAAAVETFLEMLAVVVVLEDLDMCQIYL